MTEVSMASYVAGPLGAALRDSRITSGSWPAPTQASCAVLHGPGGCPGYPHVRIEEDVD